MRGAREALEPLFTALPALDFRLAWAFIPMMKTDDRAAAEAAAARVSDPRLTAFTDDQHLLGRGMARTLGWRHHVAWDAYFLYSPGTRWTNADPPAPALWFHQLKDREMWEETAEAEVGSKDWTAALAEKSEADPACFRTGPALFEALRAGLLALAAPPAR